MGFRCVVSAKRRSERARFETAQVLKVGARMSFEYTPADKRKIRRIHKFILQGKLKWIRSVDGLSLKDIITLYDEQPKNGIHPFSESDVEEYLNEVEKPIGGM